MLQDLLKDPALKKYVRAVPQGFMLFGQGERGNTMFLIIDGKVQLTLRTGSQVRVVEFIGPGEFLGEGALLSEEPFKRGLGAQAVDDVSVLELDYGALQALQAKLPGFLLQVIRLVTQRLYKTNELLGILHLKAPSEKLVHFLLFYFKYFGVKVPKGRQISINSQIIEGHTQIPLEDVEKSLQHLVRNHVLLASEENYILADEAALLSVVSSLREMIG